MTSLTNVELFIGSCAFSGTSSGAKKWWWALFLWGYKVSLENSYVMYKRYCELKGVPVQWTHHNWTEAIGYAHVDPEVLWRPD